MAFSTEKSPILVRRSLIYEGLKIKLSEEVKKNIVNCRNYLDKKIAKTVDPIYGINTGFGSLYDVRIEDKSILISSIFPESLQFDGKKCRTPRINDVLRYILQIDKDLPKNKTGQISSNLSLSRLVESPRIELGSKQANKKLSTRLVFN